MTDLKRLIEAVERGRISTDLIMEAFGDGWTDMHVLAAFDGSLDAAKALHEALLPGWNPELREWPYGLCVANVRPSHGRAVQGQAPTLARAWLIAILRAVEAGR